MDLAERAVIRFRFDRDWDDLLQESRIAAWQHAAKPAGLVRTICYRRAVDWLRARHHYRVWGPSEPVLAADVRDSGFVDPGFEQVDRSDWRPPVLGDPTLDYIIERVAAGKTKAAIAAELGVHPSRISQHLRVIRSRWPA